MGKVIAEPKEERAYGRFYRLYINNKFLKLMHQLVIISGEEVINHSLLSQEEG